MLLWEYIILQGEVDPKWKTKIPSMGDMILSMDKIFIRQNHPWMKRSYPWIKVSSLEKLTDDLFICGFYPWMKSTDKDNGWHTWTQPIHIFCGRGISFDILEELSFCGSFLIFWDLLKSSETLRDTQRFFEIHGDSMWSFEFIRDARWFLDILKDHMTSLNILWDPWRFLRSLEILSYP